MVLDRGIQILEGTSTASLPHTTTGVVIIFSVGGSAKENELFKIENEGDAKKHFGDVKDERSLATYFKILHRYGIGSALGAVAADPTAVLNKLPSAFSEFGINPEVIVMPGLSELSTGIVDNVLKIADSLGAVVIGDYGKTKGVDEIVADRAGNEGLNMKHSRLIPCYGYTKSKINPDWSEPLSVHLAGIIAMHDSTHHQGIPPSNKPLMGVDEIAMVGGTTGDPATSTGDDPEPTLIMSFVDETSSNEKLNDVGVVTLNRRENMLVSWGDRNGLYPKYLGFLSMISVVRVKDALIKIAKKRAGYFIDMQSNKRSGQLLETSLNDALAKASNAGMITNKYSAEFLEAESNYQEGKLVACMSFSPYTSVRLIQLKPIFKFTVSTN